MLAASTNFIKAEAAGTNKLARRVYLILGDYCNSNAYGASANGESDTGAYPFAGAINGDHTELNIGAASAAENDAGSSSWRSNLGGSLPLPNGSVSVSYEVSFGATRIINRLKLYHLTGHRLTSFEILAYNGSHVGGGGTLVKKIAATTDKMSGHEVEITGSDYLNKIDFADASFTHLYIEVYDTEDHGDANIVEIEAYRKIDITDRVTSFTIDRARDYRLSNPLASTVQLEVDNTDRFFSYRHVPTTTEVAAGFVNQDLRPNLGIEVEEGFAWGGHEERLVVFTGLMDTINPKSGSQTCIIKGRDAMKPLINKIISSKLKTSIDIADAIRYCLNLAGMSNYEIELDSTSIILDYFYIDNVSLLTVIRDLVTAAADAAFWIDELGIARFQSYLNLIPENKVVTTSADFAAGTVVALDSTLIADEIGDGWVEDFRYDSATLPTFTTRAGTYATAQYNSLYQTSTDNTNAMIDFPYTNSAGLYGSWWAKFNFPLQTGQILNFFFGVGGFSGSTYNSGYVLKLSGSFNVTLARVNADGSQTNLASATTLHTLNNYNAWFISRKSNGEFRFGLWTNGGVFEDLGTVTDNTFTTCTMWGIQTNFHFTQVFELSHTSITQRSDVTPSYTIVIDQGASVTQEGMFEATVAGSWTFYTATSALPGSGYSADAAATPGQQIPSPVNRYLKIKAFPSQDWRQKNDTKLFDIVANWFNGGGSPRWPTSVSNTYRYDGTIQDLEQQLTDQLGGDTAIINDVTVQAQPVLLKGNDTDVVWQGTVQTPPVAVSVAAPLAVTSGQTLYFYPVVSAMDTSRMSGANPAAAAITFGGGGAGSWTFSRIHPTRPVLKIVITSTGSITNLQLQGKLFNNSQYVNAQTYQDAVSMALYDDRQNNFTNPYIVAEAMALTVAQKMVGYFKDPTDYVPNCQIGPTPTVQVGDRINLVDKNLDVSDDYAVLGLEHACSNTSAGTRLTLVRIPT